MSNKSGAGEGDYPSKAYGWFVAILLMVIYTTSYIDRSIISLMAEPIRADLKISDTRFSLLQGTAFSLFYTFLCLVIGRLADRMRRTWLIAGGVALWSVMTAMCGLAQSFGQLFLARVGVGVGEATLSPCAYSIITDSTPRNRLAGAFSVFNVGIPLGTGLALILGGAVVRMTHGHDVHLPLLGDVKVWQAAFMAVGAPGVILALIMLTVREPVRRGLISGGRDLPLRDLFAYIARQGGAFTSIFTIGAIFGLTNFGYSAWTPTVLVRNFGWSLADIGQIYGPIVLVAGIAGLLAAGNIANIWTRRGRPDASFRMWFLIGGLMWPFLILAPLMPSPTLALIAFGIVAFLMSAWPGCAAAALASITPNQFRGQATAIYVFIGVVAGYTLGPTAVALITDYGFHDDHALRYSMSIVGGVAMPLVGLAYWLWAPAYRRTLAASAEWAERAEGAGPAKTMVQSQSQALT